MVQFRTGDDVWSHNADYWKIDSGRTKHSEEELQSILTTDGTLLAGRDLDRLRELYIRHQRGLLSYEGLDACELKLFITQRELMPIANPDSSLPELRAHLEQADDDATFERFSDLPPELRQQIFKQYFDSFDDSQRTLSPA